jgi:CubicO group peptidase (beta-lactamase class C family)
MLSTLLLFAIGQDAAAIEQVVKAEMASQGIPGLSILVQRGDDVLLRAAYGRANVELDVPARPDNVYNSGSITKTFTALTVMSLVEEGKLSLDDKVARYVEQAPETWSAITVKHLLSHTSGIPEYALIEGLYLTEEYTREFWWQKIAPLPLDFVTGKRFAYSNSNYTVLSQVIEKVTGKGFYEAVQERVISKAGLKDTKFRQTNEIVPRLATGYFKVGEEMIVSPSEASSSAFGAGGIVTTVDDLAAFLRACREGKIVSKATLAQMQTPNRTDDGRKTGYGLGWFVRDLNGHPMHSHAGNTAGYSASMAYFPDQDLTVCVMGNVYAFSGDNLAIMVARSIVEDLRPKKMTESADPDPELTKTLSKALDDLIAGKADNDDFDAEYRGQFDTGRGRMVLGSFAQYRDYEGFAFLEKRSDDPDTLYYYRIKKGDRTYRVVFTVTKERRVFAVSVQREEG